MILDQDPTGKYKIELVTETHMKIFLKLVPDDAMFWEVSFSDLAETNDEKYAQYMIVFDYLTKTHISMIKRLDNDSHPPSFSQAMSEQYNSEEHQDEDIKVHAVQPKKKKISTSKPMTKPVSKPQKPRKVCFYCGSDSFKRSPYV